MDLRFLAPESSQLEEPSVELCACSIWADERPMHGLAGLLDWLLAGRLSALLKRGFVTGARGEMVLVPGKPHVPFEKVVVLGLGLRHDFGDLPFSAAVANLARTLEGLRIRRCIVELPGRGSDAIEPDRAMTLLFEAVGPSPGHDTWWVVDTAAARKQMQARADNERRRSRSP